MDKLKQKIIAEIKALHEDGMRVLARAAEETKEPPPPEPKPRRSRVRKLDDSEIQKKAEAGPSFMVDYQSWYTRALPAIRQLLPERYEEFCHLYKLDTRPKSHDYASYTISDYLLGLKLVHEFLGYDLVDHRGALISKLGQQVTILGSAIHRIESILSDIEGLIQAHLFERELSAAGDLLKKGYLRAAGVVAGVTLEAHLAKVCADHGIKFRKASPTISDFNEELRKADVIDVPVWRHIQRLGDIRNMSAHSKEREPRSDEVEDLIVGTEKIIATIS
jgi:hypothetical protein